VEFLPGKDGLCHISELSDKRVDKATDVVKEGDRITVKLIGVDERGKVRLSRKAAMIDSGEIEAPAEDEGGNSKPEREVSDEEPEVGKLYQGTVVTVKEYGAFVEFLPGRDGLCHVSELASARVKNVEDIAKVGDKIWVKLLEIDERGKVRLSRKAALEEREAAEEEA
jgi:polyribonucleotide nucleotidyltransferase